MSDLSRREFVQGAAVGGGLVLALSLPGCRRVAATLHDGKTDAGESLSPDAYLRVAENGDVVVTVHRSEMGQGIRTSLAMAVADELEADWARVRVEQAPGDEKTYGDQNTDGSQSIRHFLLPLRQAGATARAMLEGAAAKKWNVPASDVEARLHQVVHKPSGRTVAYGELVVAAKRLPVPAKEQVKLKDPSAFRYLGKGMPSVDLMDMTTGRARYGIDATLPGMRYAVIARPPVYGGTVASVDSAEAEKVPGVERIVRLDGTPPPAGFQPLGGVAVIAKNTWAAMQGRQKLKVTWSDGANATYDSSAFRPVIEATSRRPGKVVRNEGDARRAIATAPTHVSADYYVPHLAHAMMEPPAALASFQDGRVEIWAATQHPQGARDEVAKALKIPAEQVTVHVTFLGGGFGRKSKPDYVVEAALLSKAVGAPVKVTWTREDEIRHGYYHTVTAQHLEAGLGRDGRPVAWLHRTVFPSIGSTFAPNVTQAGDPELGMGVTDLPYDIPNIRCENGEAEAHVRIGWFRSVANIQHAFAVGSFTDELAHRAGRDPKDYLLEVIGPARHVDLTRGGVKPWNYGEDIAKYPIDTARYRRAIETVAEKSGWGTPLPRGRGRGIAVHRSFVSYVAAVVQAEVGADGQVTVPRVDIAIDCGFAANPDRVKAQMEGAVIMGLSSALYGEVTFKEGRAVQGNFSDFGVVRMNVAPRELNVYLIPSDAPPGGVGEPGVPPIAPALCNAIFAATGRRIRALPVRNVAVT